MQNTQKIPQAVHFVRFSWVKHLFVFLVQESGSHQLWGGGGGGGGHTPGLTEVNFPPHDQKPNTGCTGQTVSLSRTGYRHTSGEQALGQQDRHLNNRHLQDRHLENRHLQDRHLEKRHLNDMHLQDMHLENRHFGKGTGEQAPGKQTF